MNSRTGGIATIALGSLTMATPFYLLPVCTGLVPTAAGGAIPMKCHWMAQAELGIGGLIVLLGAALLFTKTGEARRLAGLLLAGLGVLVVLMPTALIGVCNTPTMPCRVGTLPGLTILGSIVFAAGALMFLLSRRKGGEAWPVT